MGKRCNVHWLGQVEYAAAWELQEQLAGEIGRAERPATLLLLEHPHTFTFGRRGHAENLLWDAAERKRRGVAVHWVDRGGDITYHGPGQLVGYPLLPLAPYDFPADAGGIPRADYVGYVRRLERVLLSALRSLGVAGETRAGLTGVWVSQSTGVSQGTGVLPDASAPRADPPAPAKIAAIGIKVDARGVTRHGFALNINPDMSYWQGLIGCGLKDEPVTCLADCLEVIPSHDQILAALVQAFSETFELDCYQFPIHFV